MWENYEVRLRTECATVVKQTRNVFDGVYPQHPPRAFSSDMMIVYAPKRIYKDQVTVLKMICSSVCITYMIWFSTEVEYEHMLSAMVHLQDTRVSAIINATNFLMSLNKYFIRVT